jgi:oligosaccharide repeat unit polymerase
MITAFEFCLILVLFVGLIFVVSKKEADIFSPPFIFTTMWAGILVFSIISGSEYYFSFNALLYIYCMVALYNIGWIATSFKLNIKNRKIQNSETVKLLELTTYVSIIAGFVSIFLLIFTSLGDHIFNFKISDLSSLSATLSKQRYEGVRLSPIIMLLLTINYIGCFTGAAVSNLFEKKSIQLISFLVLVPLFIFSLVYTSRAVFLFGLFIFLPTWLLFQASKFHYSKAQFPVKWIYGSVLGFVFVLSLFMVSQALRMGIDHVNEASFDRIFSYLRVWFAGNISSFCMWYDQPDVSPLNAYGGFTFAGLSEAIGLGQRQAGIYNLGYDVSGKLEISNIYTLFRFVADDFGWIGSFVFFLTLGSISKLLYRSFLAGSYISLAILCGIYCLLLFSFITSILAYNSILFAWICFIGICILPYFKHEYID